MLDHRFWKTKKIVVVVWAGLFIFLMAVVSTHRELRWAISGTPAAVGAATGWNGWLG